MINKWQPEQIQRYKSLIFKQMQDGCVVLSTLFFTILTAFTLIDYVTQKPFLREILIARSITIVVFAVLFFIAQKGLHRKFPTPFAFVHMGAATVSMSAMCIIQGGFSGPYYFGVVLITLSPVLVLPINAWTMLKICIMDFGIYLFGVGLISGIESDADLEFAMHNTFSLLATGAIGVTAARVVEKLRQESFDRYLDLEKSQLQIKRSRDKLQVELHSKQENIEGLIQEISQRKVDLEKALTVAEKAKKEVQNTLSLREEFITLASHELNTPLSILNLQTEVAQSQLDARELDTEAIKRVLKSYSFQLKRLIRTVSDMLDISRIHHDRLQLDHTEVRLRPLLDQVVEVSTLQEGQRHIKINCPDQLHGRWDKFRIEQVIVNLLTNAIKYGEEKPIEITAFEKGDMIHISVKDFGIGISSEAIERVFDRFERAVSFHKFSGLGLGLYISKEIVEAHGGRIEVESKINEGSTFTVILPKSPKSDF